MGYNKRLTPKALETLRPLIRELEALNPGTSFKFQVNHQEMGDKIRNWLYTWLKINRLKPFYKIKQVGPIEFLLIRLQNGSVKISASASEETQLSPTEEYVRDNLLEFEGEEKVMKHLKTLLTSENISDQQLIDYFTEWERIQGQNKTDPKAKEAKEAPNPFLVDEPLI